MRHPIALAAIGIVVALFVGSSPTAAAPSVPGGPTGLALDGRVELAWQPVAGAETYRVYRGTTAGSITQELTSGAGVTSPGFADTTATNGTAYYYAVRAVAAGDESGPSLAVQATAGAAACTTGNVVVVENCRPGSAAWRVVNAGSVAGGGIEGFATATSVNKGESVDLKVNSGAGSTFRIEIFRSGYYGGAGARLFSTILGVPGVLQPACVKHASTTGLTDCSNWSVSARITTTAAWPSGVYLLRIVREQTTADNHILLVVRDDERHSNLLYGAALTDYQAYNNYGGKSLYDSSSTGPVTVAGTTRAVKVSFDRPYEQPRSGRRDWYSKVDFPLVQWLERSGYDVAYAGNTDLVRNGARVLDHQAYVSPAHDEYYSSNMRTALEQARDAGTSLFMSGSNAVFWKVRFEPSPISAGQDRVMVCYKSTQSGGPDPSGTHTGTWRDPNGANSPENALLGVMYVGDADNTFFPLRVSEGQGKDPVWRHTSVATLAPGTTATIGTSIVGWEWDARVANGLEPANLTTLSSSPVTGNLLQFNGTYNTYVPGSTTTQAVKYVAASGALVFSTGTNFWSRGLAVNADGVGNVQLTIQQATTNVLADMGALPQTPSSDIVLDNPNAPPTVTSISPAAGATGQARSTVVRATFSRALDPATVTASSFTLTPAGGAAVAATVSYDGATHTATLTPSAPLSLATTYTARLETTITSDNGIPLTLPVTWTFSTAAACPCSLFAPTLTPVSTGNPVRDGRSGSGPWSYELGVRLTVSEPTVLSAIRFYKDALETGSHTGKVWLANGTQLASVPFSGETSSGWQQQTLPSPLQLQPGTTYVISVNLNAYFVLTNNALQTQQTSGPLQTLTDRNGVSGATAGTFPNTGSTKKANYFVDLVVVDQASPPVVTTTVPAAGASDVGRSAPLTARFSRAMNASTISAASFTLEGPGGAPVAASVGYDAASQTATLTPSAPLAYTTSYTARLATTITADDGTPLAAPHSWTFTTVAAVAPTVTGRSPAEGATGVPRTASVQATFSRAMDPTTLTPTSFTLEGPGGAPVAASVGYDAASQTATLTPSAPLAYTTSYTARLATTITADDGTPLAAPSSWSFTTLSACPCSLFSSVLVPSSTGNPVRDGRSGSGPWSYELGVRLTVSEPTVLSAIRFYKDALETGSHTGKVWLANGTQLASVPFSGETSSGWQQQTLPSPLQLQPGTTYVISVNLNAYFVLTNNALQTQQTSGPLQTLTDRNGVSGATAGTFPNTGSTKKANYFVDLVVVDQASPPVVTTTVPAAGASDVGRSAPLTARFSRAMNASTISAASFTLEGPGGAPVAASVGYDAASQTATLTPSAPLAYTTSYTARLATTITADDGTPLAAPHSWTFTTVAAVAPTVTGRSPAEGATGVPRTASVQATFSRAMDPTTLTPTSFTLEGPGGAPVAASVGYDAASQTATLTPSAPLAYTTSYTARLATTITADDGTPLAAPSSWSFTTLSACPCSLFSSVLVPSSTGNPVRDGRSGSGPWSYELGVRLTVSEPTVLSAIRFYKDALETGSHTGKVWLANGTQLASVPFSGETSSGWQQQTLPSPLQLQPGTTYVISVNLNAYFVLTNNALQTQQTSGPLQTLTDRNGVSGATAGTFPDTGSPTRSNYFVDLVAE